MNESDPDQLADELEREARQLEQRSEKLGEETRGTREDWERKRADDDVPGAVPREQDEPDEPPTGAPPAHSDPDES